MGTIKYYLMPNLITPDPNDQTARVKPKEVLDENIIAERMVNRSSSFTLPIISGVLQLFFDVVADEVANGNYVNTPVANIKPGISGIFASATDSFDPSRHILKASVSGGAMLNQKLRLSQTEKILRPLVSPYIVEFNDVNSKTFNSKITPGGIGIISGEELKFNPDAPLEGIFFIDEDSISTKVTNYASWTDGKVIFTIPSTLIKGYYKLKVCKAYGKDKDLREGEFHETLSVPA